MPLVAPVSSEPAWERISGPGELDGIGLSRSNALGHQEGVHRLKKAHSLRHWYMRDESRLGSPPHD